MADGFVHGRRIVWQGKGHLHAEDLFHRGSGHFVLATYAVQHHANLVVGVVQRAQDVEQPAAGAAECDARLGHHANAVAVVEHADRQRVDALPDVENHVVVVRLHDRQDPLELFLLDLAGTHRVGRARQHVESVVHVNETGFQERRVHAIDLAADFRQCAGRRLVGHDVRQIPEVPVQVDDEHTLAEVAGEGVAKVCGHEAGASATLAGDHRYDLRYLLHARHVRGFHALQRLDKLAFVQRPWQHIAHAGTHRLDQHAGILRLCDQDAGQFGVLLAQGFHPEHLRGSDFGQIEHQQIGHAQPARLEWQTR